MAPNGKMSMVKYNTYTFIEKIKKLLVLKFDSLQNMLGVAWKLLHVVRLGVKMKDNYMNVNNQYAKNKW